MFLVNVARMSFSLRSDIDTMFRNFYAKTASGEPYDMLLLCFSNIQTQQRTYSPIPICGALLNL